MKKIFVPLLAGLFLLAACSSGVEQLVEPPVEPTIESGIEPSVGPAVGDPYPAPVIETSSNQAYPSPAQTADPNAPKVTIVPFQIDRPIAVGATTISGTGPAGVPILIVDVTMYGELLAKTTIQPDGTFSVTLPVPIEANHRIGLSLDDLAGSGWTEDTFSDPGFFGQEFKLIPMVGVYYDTVLVN